MKYLVTDDSKLARLSLIKLLREQDENAEIFQAENGEIALEILKVEDIKVVFLDLTMPVMDGYTALPLMLKQNPDLNIIVVSADVQVRAQTKVMELGAKQHIQKPINVNKMQELLATL